MVLGNENLGEAGHLFGFDHDLVAYAGFAIMVLSSRFKQRSTYILVETLGIVVVAVYWLLLVQFEAALDDLFYVVLNLSAIWVLGNARLRKLYYLNYPLLLGASLYLYDAWPDALAVACSGWPPWPSRRSWCPSRWCWRIRTRSCCSRGPAASRRQRGTSSRPRFFWAPPVTGDA